MFVFLPKILYDMCFFVVCGFFSEVFLWFYDHAATV